MRILCSYVRFSFIAESNSCLIYDLNLHFLVMSIEFIIAYTYRTFTLFDNFSHIAILFTMTKGTYTVFRNGLIELYPFTMLTSFICTNIKLESTYKWSSFLHSHECLRGSCWILWMNMSVQKGTRIPLFWGTTSYACGSMIKQVGNRIYSDCLTITSWFEENPPKSIEKIILT